MERNFGPFRAEQKAPEQRDLMLMSLVTAWCP